MPDSTSAILIYTTLDTILAKIKTLVVSRYFYAIEDRKLSVNISILLQLLLTCFNFLCAFKFFKPVNSVA